MSKTIAYETANGPQQVDAAHPLPVNATVSATAAALATAVAPTLVEGSTNPFSSDLAGGLRITGTINATSATANTAAAPSYSEGTSNAFSANLAGDLRVIAKQSGTWVIGAGSAVIGKTSIDQTTPGTTNAVAVTNLPVTVDVNSGVKSNSTIRMVFATDQPQNTNAFKVDGSAVTQPVSIATAPVLVAGSAVIGKVGIDQTTPGTTNLVAAGQNGTWTVQPGNTANTTPWLMGHGKTIKTASGTLTADTDVIAAVTSKRIKVIAYSLFTTGTNVDLILFKSNGAAGTELWRVPLQTQASALFGANLAIAAPSFLFATVAGEKLTMDVNQTDTIHYSITYFDDDAT